LDALNRQLEEVEPTVNCFDIIKNTLSENTIIFYEEEKLLPRIAQTMQNCSQPELVVRWVRILGEFSVISDYSCQVPAAHQMVLDYGGLDQLENLLEHSSRRVRKETLWVLSNISAGSWFQTGALIERSNLLQQIFRLMHDEPREVARVDQVRMEATWVICNSCMNLDPQQIELLIGRGFINMLQSHFTTDHTDKAVQIMLQGIKEMLRTLQREQEYQLLAKLCSLLTKIDFKQKLVALKPQAHRKNLAPVNFLLEVLDARQKSDSSSQEANGEEEEEAEEDQQQASEDSQQMEEEDPDQ